MEFTAGGAWPRRRAGPGGDVLGAGADGGQRLLAAAQEGRVVGALMAAVAVVRLPSLALPFPLTAEDPDEGLRSRGKIGETVERSRSRAACVRRTRSPV